MGLENGDGVAAIDTLTNHVIATMPGGQSPQALVYVPDAVPSGAAPAVNLAPLGQAGAALHLKLVPPPGSADSGAGGNAAVNEEGLADLLQVAVTGLRPKSTYAIGLADSATRPFGKVQIIGTFKINPSGSGIGQVLGPLRQVFTGSASGAVVPLRFLVVLPMANNGTGEVSLVQQTR